MILNYEKMARVHSFQTMSGPLVIRPGANAIKDSDWNELKKHPTVQKMLSAGFFKVLLDKDPPAKEEGADEVFDLASVNSKKATEIVENTLDESLLTSWMQAEDRKGVLNAIEKQLEKIVIEPHEPDIHVSVE